ncbi:response regulator transcription factor [Spirochaeta isovalerica]|uniref:DNA-binding response OmpR family regulator n=1 Tax=Spirochaeta isovalerica TaxID=150 RepID=A0A841R6S6_9SPIO|nr:response regulator transcription factor [Spirochaeta isovalerica]MBB6480914.1 DNA-binding response OmpR family regulator [Spirochaeta isovalerica]
MNNVLLVEDDLAISDLLEINLSMSGFTVECSDGIQAAAELINEKEFSIVLLDLSLNDGYGLSLIPVCESFKIPVLILTADNSLRTKINSLNLGADDYVVKPFETAELIARIHAILRRSGQVEGPSEEVIDDIIIDVERRGIVRDTEEIYLTTKEWHLLLFLLRNRGYVLSRDVLLDKVWGYDYYGNSRTVDMHIQRLRSKLGTDKISTVYKEGYRLEL